jgi:hypothetical protein
MQLQLCSGSGAQRFECVHYMKRAGSSTAFNMVELYYDCVDKMECVLYSSGVSSFATVPAIPDSFAPPRMDMCKVCADHCSIQKHSDVKTLRLVLTAHEHISCSAAVGGCMGSISRVPNNRS